MNLSYYGLCYNIDMRKYIASSIAITIVIGIFISSSQTYEEQTLIPFFEKTLPNKPLEPILSFVSTLFWDNPNFLGEDGYYNFLEFILRKSAHFGLFGILASGIFLSLPTRLPRFIIATLITLVLASADETHQYFTGGRTASIRDVLLDMSGALVFLVILQLLSCNKSRKNRTVIQKE